MCEFLGTRTFSAQRQYCVLFFFKDNLRADGVDREPKGGHENEYATVRGRSRVWGAVWFHRHR